MRLVIFLHEFITESGGEVEPVTALLWSYHYLAHHFDQKRQLTEALKYADLGLEHTPLLIELYVLKAKILKVKHLITIMQLFFKLCTPTFN